MTTTAFSSWTGVAHVLAPSGAIVLEVGAGQAGEVRALLGEGWSDISVTNDLAGIPRVVSGVRG